MMKNKSTGHFYTKIYSKKRHFPLTGHIELTYRCSLNCVHCYCKGSEDRGRELSTGEWKDIFDVLQGEGCLWLIFTGGDPLIRDDFLELYSYARTKGFIITLFTSGHLFTGEIIDYLLRSPPFSIEITLNGITKGVYESITQVQGSFSRVIETIKELADKKLPLTLKTNALKQNRHQIGEIKAFAEELLGKPADNKHHFAYDLMIYPRLNGDKTPCEHRLSYKEMLEVQRQDPDMWKEGQECLKSDFPKMERDRSFLYQCDSWRTQFFIGPYGKLKICEFEDKYSFDLKTRSFRDIFYNEFPKLLDEKFKTDSKCRNCDLRAICYNCPPKAIMETGSAEGAAPFYCQLARDTAKEVHEKKVVS